MTSGTEFIPIGWKIVPNEEHVQCDHRFASQPLANEPLHSSQLFDTSLQKARGTTWLCSCATFSGLLWWPENVTQLRAHIVKLCRALSEDLCRKGCDECKGSFARGCEAKRWSHWTCSSLGTTFQPTRINSVPDVKCFCNNKNVLCAQSMVWHFVRHLVYVKAQLDIKWTAVVFDGIGVVYLVTGDTPGERYNDWARITLFWDVTPCQ